HILAFHSSLLLPHLPPNTLIIKDLPPPTRESLRQTSTQYLWTRSQYNGWGLTSPSTYPLPRGPGFHNECLAKHGCRGYADEALKMERAILLSGPTGTEAVIHAEEEKRRDFARWYLTTDHSLVGATREELAAVIGGPKAAESGEWDSAPLELVSPPFALDEEAGLEEIAAVLKAVRGGKDDDLHRAFTDEWCGFHVHIGLPPKSSSSSSCNEEASFPLPVLQHLAYITTVYEPAISSLHPPSRRPDRDATGMDLASNRDLLLPEPDFAGVDWDAVEAVYDSGYASSDDDLEGLCSLDLPLTKKNRAPPTTTTTTPIIPTTASFTTTTTTAEEEAAAAAAAEEEEKEEADKDDAYERRIQQRARDLLFAPGQTLKGLCDVMSSGGQRGRVVNWTYLARKPGKGPRTVEFRQHEGCLDAAEVRSWVKFCGAL
ncbi:MAG: hypothetical protein Q9173_007369, partial [Seirophora scorigena]